MFKGKYTLVAGLICLNLLPCCLYGHPAKAKLANNYTKIDGSQHIDYYAIVNDYYRSFALTADSVHLEKLYLEVLSWEDTIVTNCFLSTLDDAQVYFNRRKDFEKLESVFTKQIKCGLRKGQFEFIFNSTNFSDFFNSTYGKKVKGSYDQLFKEHQLRLNLGYYTEVAALVQNDIFSRNLLYGNFENSLFQNYIGVFKNIDDSLNKQIQSTVVGYNDSVCFEQLIRLYDKYGFPSNTKVGRGGLGMLYAHFFLSCTPVVSSNGIHSDIFLDSIMKKAVKNYEYNASEYAFWKDNSVSPHSRSCPKPYSIYGTPKNISRHKKKILDFIIDIDQIDKRRSEINIPPLWVDAILNQYELPTKYKIPVNCPKCLDKK